jgi:hypothetical protein
MSGPAFELTKLFSVLEELEKHVLTADEIRRVNRRLGELGIPSIRDILHPKDISRQLSKIKNVSNVYIEMREVLKVLKSTDSFESKETVQGSPEMLVTRVQEEASIESLKNLSGFLSPCLEQLGVSPVDQQSLCVLLFMEYATSSEELSHLSETDWEYLKTNPRNPLVRSQVEALKNFIKRHWKDEGKSDFLHPLSDWLALIGVEKELRTAFADFLVYKNYSRSLQGLRLLSNEDWQSCKNDPSNPLARSEVTALKRIIDTSSVMDPISELRSDALGLGSSESRVQRIVLPDVNEIQLVKPDGKIVDDRVKLRMPRIITADSTTQFVRKSLQHAQEVYLDLSGCNLSDLTPLIVLIKDNPDFNLRVLDFSLNRLSTRSDWSEVANMLFVLSKNAYLVVWGNPIVCADAKEIISNMVVFSASHFHKLIWIPPNLVNGVSWMDWLENISMDALKAIQENHKNFNVCFSELHFRRQGAKDEFSSVLIAALTSEIQSTLFNFNLYDPELHNKVYRERRKATSIHYDRMGGL